MDLCRWLFSWPGQMDEDILVPLLGQTVYFFAPSFTQGGPIPFFTIFCPQALAAISKHMLKL